MPFKRLGIWLLVGGCGFLVACGKAAPELLSASFDIETQAGAIVELKLELADDAAKRERGLMYRKKLDDGKGMLFIFETDQLLSFWMKNTTLALSIAYIASDGTILEIYDLQPLSLLPVQSRRSARYALEVPQGWFKRAAVTVGDRLKLEN